MNNSFVITLNHESSYEFQHMVDNFLMSKLFVAAFKPVVTAAYKKEVNDSQFSRPDLDIEAAIRDEIKENHLFLFWVSSKQTPSSAWESQDDEEIESTTNTFPIPFYEISQHFEAHLLAIGFTISKSDSDSVLNAILKKQDNNYYWVNEYYGSGTGLSFIALSNNELKKIVATSIS